MSNTYQKNRRRAQPDPVPGQAAVPEQVIVSMAESVNFYGTHSVDVDGESAKLDADGYRPLRAAPLGRPGERGEAEDPPALPS